MNIGLVSLLFACVVCVAAQNLPVGILAIPPLPIQVNPPFPGKGTTKSPPKIVTKKPVTTKAPFKPPTTLRPIPTTTLRPSPTTQRPAPPSVPTPSNCQYAINVPQANCNGSNRATQQALAALKQDLDRTRQQHQAQDAQVQAKISQLLGSQTGYLTKISDLQNEVTNLVSAFNALSCTPTSTTPATGVTPAPTAPSGGVNPSPALQQAIQSVKNDLNQAVTDFNNKMQGINSQIQNNNLQASQVDIQIEAQILKQGTDIASMTQLIADLKKQLQQVQSKNGTGSGATSQDVARLQADIQKISADIQQYDQTQHAKFNQLNTKSNSLNAKVAQHTSDIQGFRTRVLLAESQLNDLDQNVTVVYGAFKQFLTNYRNNEQPQIRQTEADVKDLITNTTNMKRDIDRVGQSTLNILLSTSKDRQILNGLKTQSHTLQSMIANISSGLTQQGQTIVNVQNNVRDLTKSVPVADLTKMNNAILTILASPTQTPSAQQLKDLKDGITAIQRALTTSFPSG